MGAVPDDTTAAQRRARQERVLAAVAGVVVLLMGLGTTAASVWKAAHATDHWRALRAAGTPVMATVAEQRLYSSKSYRDRIRLVYDYDGRHVDVWTKCAAPRGCNPPPGPQVKVWIDPANPADFVQDAEDTSRWVGVLGYGVFTLFGAVLTVGGALAVVVAIRSGRRPAAAGRAVPARRGGSRLGRRPARRPRRPRRPR
jgi:hypothetical protein